MRPNQQEGTAGSLWRRLIVLSLCVCLLPACAARRMPDWTRVQAVPRETKTEVQLHQDKTRPGGKSQKIKGQFQLATADSITLKLEDGQMHTLEKQAVRHCHVNRVGPQRPAWIPFQSAALALSHRLNASFRNRLNVSLLHK